MFMEIIIFILTAIFFAFLFHRKPKGLPPGEWGIPILGYMPFMDWKISNSFNRLGKKHGKIFCVKLGSQTFIVISDYSLLKEAYNRPEISGRPFIFGNDIVLGCSELGLLTSSGHIWSTNRRFVIQSLKDFGLGKSKMEESVLTEAEHLVTDLKKNVNKPFKIFWNLNVAVVNVIWRLVADRRYDINDQEIKEFLKNANECIECIDGSIGLLFLFPGVEPWLPDVVRSWMKIHKVTEKRDKLLAFIMNIVEEHKKNLDINDPKDYIDKYLIEHLKQKDNPDYAHWGDSDLLVSVLTLFMAGSDTTSSILRWFFLYMAKHPHVQKRVQEEIDGVLPRDKLPSWENKDVLPCLQALSFEVGRVVSLLPNGLTHIVAEDSSLGGYLIPKGSLVVPNAESIHSDPNLWDHPNEFSIDNFLDEEGNFVLKEGVMTFSIGRRQCLGFPIAKIELFIFMGAILQNFEILEPEGEKISLIPDQTVNVFNYPSKCGVVLKNRT